MTMDLGEYGLLDTCRCYHFGSRKDKKPRKLIFLHFTSPFAENFPTIFRKPHLEKSNEEERLLYGYVRQDYKVLKSEKIKDGILNFIRRKFCLKFLNIYHTIMDR